MYRPNFYESTCLRCNEIVYQVDRVGPLKDFTFFHSGCFKCVHCGTKLTLKTYFNNQHKHEDKEVKITFFTLHSKIKHYLIILLGLLQFTCTKKWSRPFGSNSSRNKTSIECTKNK